MKRKAKVIELATASVETKGPGGPITDGKLGIARTGLNND